MKKSNCDYIDIKLSICSIKFFPTKTFDWGQQAQFLRWFSNSPFYRVNGDVLFSIQEFCFNLAMELSILSKASCLRNIYQLQNSIWRIFRSEKFFFFPNKKSSAINRNVCIQLFYNDNDNTWWRSPRQTSFPWCIRLHILSLQSNMLHLIEIFIFSHKAPVYFQSWIWRLKKRGDASVLFLCL